MIYQTFSTSDVVAGRTQTVSSGFFIDGTNSVQQGNFSYNPSQIQATGSNAYDIQNGLYYWDIYYNNQVHFSIAYGDLYNSGSSVQDITTVKVFPFEANYKSYSNLLLSPSETLFSFLTGSYDLSAGTLSSAATTSPRIFIINFGANLYKNQVDAGQLQFSLIANNNQVYTFIDDSTVLNKTSNVYNIIQGAIDDTTGVPTPIQDGNGNIAYKGLGLFYPKTGIIILNADTIAGLIGTMPGKDSANTPIAYPTNLSSPSQVAYNTFQSCLYTALVTASSLKMKARKSELIPTTQYYVRVQNANYNYTNNPTFVSDGTDGLVRGTIKIPELRTDPQTFITTVGLYDDSNELVAVAKLSRPVPKNFGSEYLIKVNLAY